MLIHENRLKLRLDKYLFLMTMCIEYLGYTINDGSIRPGSNKITSIKKSRAENDRTATITFGALMLFYKIN